MSYGDHSAQRCFKSNAPSVLRLRLDSTITARQGAGGVTAHTAFRHNILNFFIVLSLQILSRYFNNSCQVLL